jgi:predicted O-methyltransferase YrrM
VITDAQFEALVDAALPHSDMSRESLAAMGRLFVVAHQCAPGELSVEIGTRRGGSALLMLSLLDLLYADDDAPMLFTVDPYGNKPYTHNLKYEPLTEYGDDDFASAKDLLASRANHTHWYCRSEDFFEGMGGRPYWRGGVRRPIDDFAFVLLDGAHDLFSITHEIDLVLPRLHHRGFVVIDNIEVDPRTVHVLSSYGAHSHTPGQAFITRLPSFTEYLIPTAAAP